MPPAGLSVRGLSKAYGAVQAVRDITFDAAPGEVFGLLGPNGAGKTSTLECIVGLRRPDAGKLTFGDLDLANDGRRAKSLVGALLQETELQDKITPRQALRLFAAFYSEAESPAALIQQFALDEKADAPFASLSSGQKQRLFLALAFVNRPRLVVLDEPTSGLDPQSRRELHAVIRAQRHAGKTILLSTHQLEEAAQLCDRVGIIDHGRIVALGTPNDLVAKSNTSPRIVLRTARPLNVNSLPNIPGVVLQKDDGCVAVVTTSEINASLAAIIARLSENGIELLEVHLQRPSLEDVFLEVTGRTYSNDSDSAGRETS